MTGDGDGAEHLGSALLVDEAEEEFLGVVEIPAGDFQLPLPVVAALVTGKTTGLGLPLDGEGLGQRFRRRHVAGRQLPPGQQGAVLHAAVQVAVPIVLGDHRVSLRLLRHGHGAGAFGEGQRGVEGDVAVHAQDAGEPIGAVCVHRQVV